MLRLFLSSVLFALTLAAPSEVDILSGETAYAPTTVFNQNIATVPLFRSALVAEPTHVQVHEPTLAKVGDVVESVPTAVSHQSSTIVHSRAQRLTPIVAPAVRSYTAPAVRTYAAPVIEHAPVLRSAVSFDELGPAAAFVHAHAPVQLRSYTPLRYVYGSPLVYAASPFKK